MEVNIGGFEVSDVGSGAGFPGAVLKIFYKNSINMTLIEPSWKRCAFLEHLDTKLNIGFKVICKRAEEVDLTFDLVMSRAIDGGISKLEVLKNLSRKYLIYMIGENQAKEIDCCEVSLKDLKAYMLFIAKTR